MSNPRKAVPSLSFNGKNVTKKLKEFLESVSYTDVASGDSDSIDISLHNIGMKWMGAWYPKKGDKISGSITFQNWNAEGKHLKLDCGKFVLDSIKFSGGPLKATFGALAIPASESFKSRERTKTWKKVTVKKIATEIAKRYKLNLSYSGPSITINAIEQSEKSDSAFLYEVCKSYGLSMKVFNSKIVIYDQTAQEKKKSVAAQLQPVMQEAYRLAYIRKPEFMGNTRTEEKDPKFKIICDLPWSEHEIKERLTAYKQLSDKVEQEWHTLSAQKKETYFQLAKYPVQTAPHTIHHAR